MPRLFHFSEDPGIGVFVPRSVQVPSARRPGQAWLNGALVWAIDERRQSLYLFPRECPRILMWALPESTQDDMDRWLGGSSGSEEAVAYVERAWVERIDAGVLFRYELPGATFRDLDDAGMWVSPESVTPLVVDRIIDLPAALRRTGTELRVVDSLLPLREVWASTLHASGVRLRNAAGWSA